MAFQQEELWESASERIPWHEKLEGEVAIQNHVHEWVFYLTFCMHWVLFCASQLLPFECISWEQFVLSEAWALRSL